MHPSETAPMLAPPGAGLPWVEGLLTRHFFFPAFCGFHPWDRCELLYKQESDLILNCAVHLNPADVTRRVLIPRIFGIEDNSRHWSVAMTLEHLMIVGTAVRDTIIALSKGITPDRPVDITAVKPTGAFGREIIEQFRTFVDEYVWEIQEHATNRYSKTKFHHPWFGDLNVYQWVALGALHQRIHRRQVERICLRLNSFNQR